MKLGSARLLRRGVYLQRRCYCKQNFYERVADRLTDFPNKYTRKNEESRYSFWEKNKYFEPRDGESEHFKMILPPPNVTGVLHLGHALTCTIQDVLARWHRMKGKSVIWVPGLDHAGIATHVVVEKYLRKKGASQKELSGEIWLSHLEAWKDEKGNEIRKQLRALGASLDWNREYFTMSKEHNAAVNEALLILSERGLLYRGKYMVNWSPALKSTISDMEIDYIEVDKMTDIPVHGYKKNVRFGEMAKVAFKLENSAQELVVGTTRVETMLGDVALAVHPEDERYSRYIGQRVYHPLREVYIPVIGDKMVRRDFGTGVVKITPAHSHDDLEVAKRHDLEIISVIGENGVTTGSTKLFTGMRRFDARKKILQHLTNFRILRGLENHKMLVPVCQRSGDVVEYLVRDQWFVRTEEMADRAARAVQDGSLKIEPPEWGNIWCQWLRNTRDWCLSRQISWGHRIPAYCYQDSTGAERWIIARSEEEARSKLVRENSEYEDVALKQDEDVLDTWFSSALLPLSALGWPQSTKDLKKYYPLSLMETGHDIVILWVARMAMLGLELSDELPFKEVLLHGVLCDSDGRKMSKSLGNVIRPEHVINGISLPDLKAEVRKSYEEGLLSKKEMNRATDVNAGMFPNGIPECGADALRMTLCSHNIKHTRISFDVNECKTYNQFCNKIWQAVRYVLGMIDENVTEKPKKLTAMDRWILSRLSRMVAKVNEAFRDREFCKATTAVRQFFHYEFCDFFLEATKMGFKSGDLEVVHSHTYCLTRCLEVFLRVLAPIMPYIADDLYIKCAKKLPNVFLDVPTLLDAPFPTCSGEIETDRDLPLEERIDRVLELVRMLRTTLVLINVKKNFGLHLVIESSEIFGDLEQNLSVVSSTTKAETVGLCLKSDYEIGHDPLIYQDKNLGCDVYLSLETGDQAQTELEENRQRIVEKLNGGTSEKDPKEAKEPEEKTNKKKSRRQPASG